MRVVMVSNTIMSALCSTFQTYREDMISNLQILFPVFCDLSCSFSIILCINAGHGPLYSGDV